MIMIKINFQSEEALYQQVRNQIVLGIATEAIQEGETLPSVRRMADEIGINMHTVNKAYAMLRDEGFVTLDRRRGAIISLDLDRVKTMEETRYALRNVLAKAKCKGIRRDEIHRMVDDILDGYL